MKKILLIVNLLMASITVNANVTAVNSNERIARLQEKIREIQKIEIDRLFSERNIEGYWHYPPQMGSLYSAQYWLLAKWLGIDIPNFDTKKFIQIVLDDQLSNGSWYFLPDKSITIDGQVGASVMNYWALKAMGVPVTHPKMLKAKQWILDHGGLEASNNAVKAILPCFGNLAWKAFPVPPNIPFLNPKTVIGMVSPHVGRWMRSFIPAVAYLATVRASRVLGGNFQIPELLKDKSLAFDERKMPKSKAKIPKLAMAIYHSHRIYGGSWGGTTIASLLSMMALRHAESYMPEMKTKFEKVIAEGAQYVNELQLGSQVSAYRGAVFDGRYWDSVLIGNTLLEAGVPASKLKVTADYVNRFVNHRTGGMAFGKDYEPDPDTDDTAEMILFFQRGRFHNQTIAHGIQFLNSMQNTKDQSDGTPGKGGWGAYDRNNNAVFPIKQITTDYTDSTWIFDPATPDVTAHILEAYGAIGYRINQNNSTKVVEDAVDYMRISQKSNGTWFGRWGVNSIYGTSASIVGLRAVGIGENDPMISKGLTWIEGCQKMNGDGGFGESFLSYRYKDLNCLGAPSTPTQTAWALSAYLSVNDLTSEKTIRAIEFLVNSYDLKAGWKDELINGTGHPVVVPIFYPSYARAFPLQAISRWLNQLQSDK